MTLLLSLTGCTLESSGARDPDTPRVDSPGGGSTATAPNAGLDGTTGMASATTRAAPMSDLGGGSSVALPPDFGRDASVVDATTDATLPEAAVDAARDGGSSEPTIDAARDAGGAPDATVDPPEAAECIQTGRYALRFHTSVLWEAETVLGVSVIEGGEGELSMAVLADLERDGSELRGEVWPCDATQPDFQSTEVVGAEIYSAYFEPSVWESERLPRTPFRADVGCDRPGCVLRSDTFQVLLGIAPLGDPAAPWPQDRSALEYVDHDDDGLPGATLTLRGADHAANYAYLPVGVGEGARVEAMQMGLRMTTRLHGALESCDEISGTAPAYTMETHLADCTLVGMRAGSCSEQQANLLDRNLAVWMSREVTFVGKRLADTATCTDARAALPGPGSEASE